MRVYSGIKSACIKKDKIRFMTLTLSPVSRGDMCDDECFEFLEVVKRNLIQEISRHFGKKIEYFDVFTNEGNGVLHMMYTDCFIPHDWLVETWNRLTGSFIVDIREPRGDPYDGAKYLASQYLSSQKCSLMKYHMSRNWIYGGWSKDWDFFRNNCRDWSKGRLNEYGMYYWPIDKRKLYNSWDLHLRRKFGFDGWIDDSNLFVLKRSNGLEFVWNECCLNGN